MYTQVGIDQPVQFYIRYAHSAGLARPAAMRRLYETVFIRSRSPRKKYDLEWLNMRRSFFLLKYQSFSLTKKHIHVVRDFRRLFILFLFFPKEIHDERFISYDGFILFKHRKK